MTLKCGITGLEEASKIYQTQLTRKAGWGLFQAWRIGFFGKLLTVTPTNSNIQYLKYLIVSNVFLSFIFSDFYE